VLSLAANSLSSPGSYSFAATNAFAFDFESTPSFTMTVSVTDAGIDGPRAYTAQATVNVLVAPSSVPPSLPSYSFTVAEHTGVGATVGSLMKAVTSVPCVAPATCPTFAYSLSPALGNLNQPFPFAVTTVAGVPSWALASAQIVVAVEQNAEQVEGFALKPIRGRPHAGDRCDDGHVIIRRESAHAHAPVMPDRQQVRHNCEARAFPATISVLLIIKAAQVYQLLKAGRIMVAQRLHH
jgi:hypothetical protein